MLPRLLVWKMVKLDRVSRTWLRILVRVVTTQVKS